VIAADFDAAQFWQAPQTDEAFVRQLSGFQQNHQISSACERTPDARFVAEQPQSFNQVRRCFQFVIWKISAHNKTDLTSQYRDR
jgi:hypothetical protein